VTYPDWSPNTPGQQPGSQGQPGQPPVPPGQQPVPPQGGWTPGQSGQPPVPPGQQPFPPQGAWAPGYTGTPPSPGGGGKSGAKKWLTIGLPIAAAVVIGLGMVGFLFGSSEPEVGDCITQSGETAWEVVECDSDKAQFRVIGVEDEQQTQTEFEEDPDSCSAFAATEMALWSGVGRDKGTVYCTEPV
jgi:hypothetical protein